MLVVRRFPRSLFKNPSLILPAQGSSTEGLALIRVLLPILGGVLMVLILTDVFLTVLYARIGTGFISHRLACWSWWGFKGITKPFPRRRDQMLSFAGPAILVMLVAIWVIGLMIGGALIIQPALGSSFLANQGTTSTDFVTALYVSGDALTTVGVSDISPKSAPMRLFMFCESFLGIFIITMAVTYFLEIYNSLLSRNVFAMKVHMMSGGTADAGELLAGLGPDNLFQPGYAHLSEMAAEMVSFEESHHFYSVLLYFRFREPHYALSRLAMITLDLVTLIKSALDDQEAAWLKQSAAVAQLWRSTMTMLTLLAMAFLPDGIPETVDGDIDEQTQARWRARYFAACRRLREAGIKTIRDEEQGAEVYLSLRARWQRYIDAFTVHMAHRIETIDPVGMQPEIANDRQELVGRLRGTD